MTQRVHDPTSVFSFVPPTNDEWRHFLNEHPEWEGGSSSDVDSSRRIRKRKMANKKKKRKKSWRDVYHHDKTGKMTGWTRQRGDVVEKFDTNGNRIVRADEDGHAAETRAVRYGVRHRKPNEVPVIEPIED